MLLLAMLLACTGADTDDTDTDTDVADTQPEPDPCDELTIAPQGPSEPVVGDQWTILMYCDDALMMGAYVIRFDPSDLATIANENVATFQRAGTGVLHVQSGSFRQQMDVTVGEP